MKLVYIVGAVLIIGFSSLILVNTEKIVFEHLLDEGNGGILIIDDDVNDFVSTVEKDAQLYHQEPSFENYNQLIATIMSDGFDILKKDESWI